MRIILVGGPAAGKTTLGQAIAKAKNLACVDTDQWIEMQWGKSVASIFAELGEAVFRERETEALQALLQQPNAVISTGGGIIKKAENRDLLKKEAHVIYLKVSIAAQLKRTEHDQTRPLLRGPDKALILAKLQEERDPLYRSVASLVVNADLPVAEILKVILYARVKC